MYLTVNDIKHQTGLKRLKLRKLKQTLRLAFVSFKQSIATQKNRWGRTKQATAANLKEPLMHQSRRAHLFCDPPRRMAISVHGTMYQRGRRILQTGGLRGSMRVRHLFSVQSSLLIDKTFRNKVLCLGILQHLKSFKDRSQHCKFERRSSKKQR